MKLSKVEQETIILFNEAEADMEVYTYNPAMQKQLLALRESHPAQVRMTQQGSYGSMSFQLPKKWLRIVPPRVLSSAQRAVLDRMNQKHHSPE